MDGFAETNNAISGRPDENENPTERTFGELKEGDWFIFLDSHGVDGRLLIEIYRGNGWTETLSRVGKSRLGSEAWLRRVRLLHRPTYVPMD